MSNNDDFVLIYHPDGVNACCREVYFPHIEAATIAFDTLSSAGFLVRLFPLTVLAIRQMKELNDEKWQKGTGCSESKNDPKDDKK